MPGLNLRHAAIAAAAALALAGVAAWADAQQSAGAPQPAASTPAAKPAVPAPHAAAKPQKALDKPLWRDLTPAQQVALEPLSGEWNEMDGVRKRKWLEMANRFATMKPEEQQRVHERMRDWVKLTPAQRKLARDTYKRTKKLAPEQKTATWQSYQQLPDDQKKKLAAASAARRQAAQPGGHPVPQHRAAPVCPAGSVKNPVSATPACVPAPAALTPPAPPAIPASNAN